VEVQQLQSTIERQLFLECGSHFTTTLSISY